MDDLILEKPQSFAISVKSTMRASSIAKQLLDRPKQITEICLRGLVNEIREGRSTLNATQVTALEHLVEDFYEPGVRFYRGLKASRVTYEDPRDDNRQKEAIRFDNEIPKLNGRLARSTSLLGKLLPNGRALVAAWQYPDITSHGKFESCIGTEKTTYFFCDSRSGDDVPRYRLGPLPTTPEEHAKALADEDARIGFPSEDAIATVTCAVIIRKAMNEGIDLCLEPGSWDTDEIITSSSLTEEELELLSALRSNSVSVRWGRLLIDESGELRMRRTESEKEEKTCE